MRNDTKTKELLNTIIEGYGFSIPVIAKILQMEEKDLITYEMPPIVDEISYQLQYLAAMTNTPEDNTYIKTCVNELGPASMWGILHAAFVEHCPVFYDVPTVCTTPTAQKILADAKKQLSAEDWERVEETRDNFKAKFSTRH